jgi:hypothetical protein
MTTQNYLMIQENVVTNICLWDGNAETWQPPQDATMLIAETTPTIVWKLNTEKTEFVLTDSIGDADIGFTWNGTVATTNQLQPPNPPQTDPNSGQIPTTIL